MTKDEAKAYLAGLVPQLTNVIALDPAQWEDFKASVIVLLDDPVLEAKYRAALETVNTTVDEALK